MKHLHEVRRRRIQVLHGSARFIAPQWQEALAKCGIEPSGDWRTVQPGTPVDKSRTTEVFRVRCGGTTVYFKRYILPPHKKWRYFLRTSRAAGEWYGLESLRKIGIDAPRVLGFGEDRVLGRLETAYIITEGIEDALTLEEFARDVWTEMPPEERLSSYRRIREKLISQLRLAHEHRVFHRDLHWRNLLIRSDNDSGYEIWWIDCPRAAKRRVLWRKGRLVDFSCLARSAPRYLSHSEQLRFLRDALASEPMKAVKSLYRKIDRQLRQLKYPLQT